MLLILPAAAVGQIAFDAGDPADPAYADGWDEGDDGGFGFMPWTGGMYANPWEIDSGAPEPDNNLTTPAFRYGTGGFGYWAGERFTLYNFYAKFRFGTTIETYGSDEWGFYRRRPVGQRNEWH